MEGPQHQRMFLHLLCGRLADFVRAGHHPRQNANAIREYHQTLGAAFPQLASEDRGVVFKYIGEGDQVGGVAVHDHPIFAVGGFNALAVGEKVRREFGCRDGFVG